ncbi:MAG: hypothetical protein H6695_04405 [Deferribacteres bacterium]|nr:hypothetical protein [Deferribacteres bacterium]
MPLSLFSFVCKVPKPLFSRQTLNLSLALSPTQPSVIFILNFQNRSTIVAPPPSIPDEIAGFLTKNQEDLHLLPAVINIAFSGERKPEAWHVKLVNRQVSRGFNKSAPITIMLPLKIWRHLLKKNNRQLWLDAIQESQIHIHGDDAGKQAVMRFFGANIAAVNGEKPSVRKMSKAKLNGAAAKNGTAQKKSTSSDSKSTKSSSRAKSRTPRTAKLSSN